MAAFLARTAGVTKGLGIEAIQTAVNASTGESAAGSGLAIQQMSQQDDIRASIKRRQEASADPIQLRIAKAAEEQKDIATKSLRVLGAMNTKTEAAFNEVSKDTKDGAKT